VGTKLGAWISRARQQWQARFPRCSRGDCARKAKVFGPWFRPGLWLHESWYCSPPCFEAALHERLVNARIPHRIPPVIQHRIPLGLLMLSRGYLSGAQLRAALAAQSARGEGRLGYWIQQLGFASEAQITAALGLQWACPVLPAFEGDSRCSGMLPIHLQKTFCMLPVQFVEPTRVLHVAFSETIEYTALYAIEQLLLCRTEPCVLGHRIMQRALDRISQEQRPVEILFAGWRETAEVERITCSYALQLAGRKVRVAAWGEHVWVHLGSGQDATDLLFQRPQRTSASKRGP
jgi:Type II secretion system (T2SS), protein E, N-terminal domain